MKLEETRVLTLINNKGGVGKTSSCTAIGSILGILGYNCLIVDNDFQTNATATFLTENNDIDLTVMDLFKMETYTKSEVERCIIHTDYQNVDLIPSCPEHVDTNEYLYSLPEKERYHHLANALQLVKDNYDYILIDTHPDLYPVTKNALCCSDYVMTPVGADGYSFQGTALLTNSILQISSDESMNPDLQFLGVFITGSKPRTNNFQDYQEFYENELGEDYIPVTIRDDASVSAVLSWGMPLPYLLTSKNYRSSAKRWKAIYDYIELIHEIGMIEDDDYVLARGIYEVIEGNLILDLKKIDGDITINSVYLAKGVRDDFQSKYTEENSFGYKELIRELNESENLRKALKKGIINITDPDRILKYMPYDHNRSPYIKVKALGGRK